MKKKLLCFLLIVCMCSVVLLTACTSEDVAEEIANFDVDGLKYSVLKEIDKDTKAEKIYAKVIDYIGTEVSSSTSIVTVNIPAKITYEGAEYTVAEIGNLAFSQKKVTEIIVEEGVVTVADFAFGYCDMSILTLPSTITKIGEYAFTGCNSFGTLRLNAKTPPVLGNYAFKLYSEDSNTYIVSQKLKIYVPKESYELYKDVNTNPTWADYTALINK